MIIAAPKTYAEWTDCFDLLAKGENDKDVIEAMSCGTFDLSGLVGENFIEALWSALNDRATRAADAAKRRFASLEGQVLDGEVPFEEAGECIVEIIRDYKVEIQVLLRAISIDAVPPEDRKKLAALLLVMATEIQDAEVKRWNDICEYDLAEVVITHPFNR